MSEEQRVHGQQSQDHDARPPGQEAYAHVSHAYEILARPTEEVRTCTSSDVTAAQDSGHENAEFGCNVESPSTLFSPASYTPDTPTEKDLEKIEVCSVRVPTQHNDVPSEHTDSPRTASWRPSLLRLAPLTGLAALLFAVLQTIATGAVLAASHGDQVTNWRYEPNVYLAILTAFSNKAIAFAVVQGTVVTFWLRALRGTTLAQLHRDWSYGLHVYKAMGSGRNFNMLALACICATLVAVDGPLLQRASTVRPKVPRQDVPMTAIITPELPSYSSGVASLNSAAPYQAAWHYVPALIKDQADSVPMKNVLVGCSGTCSVLVRGPALAFESCSSKIDFVNYNATLTPQQIKTWDNGLGPAPDGYVVFSTSIGVKADPVAEQLEVVTTIASSPGNSTCAANVNTTTCSYVSAIAEYPLIVSGDEVRFQRPQPHPKIIAKANNTALTRGIIDSWNLTVRDGPLVKTTLAGVAFAGNLQFRVQESLIPYGDEMAEYDPPSNPFSLFAFKHTVHEGGPTYCVPSFSDPRDEIMASLNELMFRVGALYGSAGNKWVEHGLLDPGLGKTANVTGSTISTVNVFQSDLKYFAAAAAIELFTACAILVTFWGWWRLGRDFSFSPLEIAKAFEAPLLHDVASNLSGRQIAKIDSGREIGYGVPICDSSSVQSTHRNEKLAFGPSTAVCKPSGDSATVRDRSAVSISIFRGILHGATRRNKASGVGFNEHGRV